jgi:Tfp pilus assembly protein PilF
MKSKTSTKQGKQASSKNTNQQAANPASQKTLRIILGSIVAAFGLLLYVNTFGHDYCLDDLAVIKSNKYTQQGLAGIPILLHTFYWQGFWTANAGLYRPLSMILFAIEWQFFPAAPHVYHVVNVLLYALLGYLLFSFLTKLFPKVNLIFPFIVSLLFIGHPLHTEVVANIKSADELLSFIFFLLTVINLWNYFSTNKKSKLYQAVGYFFIALFAKESVVTYLLVIPLMIYYFTNVPFARNRTIFFYLLGATVVFLMIHEAVLSSTGYSKITYTYLDNSLVAAKSFADRLATAMLMMGTYFKMLIIPYPMSYDYSFNQIPITNFSDIKVLASFILYIGMTVYAIMNFKKKTLISFCIFFYLITMALVSNVVVLIGSTMADRFLFVPSLSFCLLVGHFIMRFTSKQYLKSQYGSMAEFMTPNLEVIIPTICILGLYFFTTIDRNKDWKDDFTLMTHDVVNAPNSGRTHYNKGTEIMNVLAIPETDPAKKKVLFDTAVKELEISLQIDPVSSQPYQNMAVAYYYQGNYQKSIEYSRKMLKIKPDDAGMHLYLGKACYRINDFPDAIENLSYAASHDNNTDEVNTFLGGAYLMNNDYAHAIECYKKAIELNPKASVNYMNLGSAYGNGKDYKNAIETFNKALALSPNDPQILYYLSITYQSMGDKENAALYLSKSKAARGGK